MVIQAKTQVSTGIQYNIGTMQDLFVPKGAFVQSTDVDAVSGTGAAQQVRVSGSVVGFNDAIHLTGDDAVVVINASGLVTGQNDDAVNFEGLNPTLVNRGTMTGVYGVFFDGEGGRATVTNYGKIHTESDSVSAGAAIRTSLLNFGTIFSNTGSAFFGDALRDTVVNQGTIIGDINLSLGNDIYDGRGGRVIGNIFGDNGRDYFRLGSTVETIVGGGGFDTLDFKATAGVRVDLNNVVDNTGAAKGDAYFGIERVLGSQTGSDQLRGDEADNVLRGFGGADRLFGNAGSDDLFGGNGQDTLTGGANADNFYFDTFESRGDRIADFASGVDAMLFNGEAFGDLPDGVLAASRFKTGTNAQAGDAGDRFIFNSTTDQLYFDADGTGSSFAVLVANFSNGATINASDIFIY